ncbi:MAG: SUMF1/EgtB/PvdO family nonheme iron enzyme [Anaerolineae bacterium]|nr:SUMF1/EgtB/PvdO family nonheme iron enzyme [Anaerolineae bacterium]
MSHIFISYSKKDIEFARHLRHMLQDHGFAVWMDETRLVPSEKWWPTIERNIISCVAFVVIMSPNGKDSEWIEREILVAEEEEHRKPIFPVLLDGKRWGRLANLQYQDMRQGIGATTLRAEFVEGLRQYVPAGGGKVPPPLPEPVIGTESVPLITPPKHMRWLLIAAAIVLVIGASSLVALLNQGNRDETPTVTQGVPTDDVTATIVAGVAATNTANAAQTRVALAATVTPSFTVTVTESPTLIFTPHPSELPLNVETAIAATFTGEALQTVDAIASYTKTPTATFTPTSTWTDKPDVQATVARGVEETRTANAIASYTKAKVVELTQTANAIASYTKTPTPTFTFTPSNTPTPTNTLTPTFTPTPSVTLTPTRDPLAKVTSNTEWKPFIRNEIFNGAEMVLVPPGCFMMGNENGFGDEKPVHKVCFNAPFWIDRYEITRKQYGGEGSFNDNTQPVVSISWINADLFCKTRHARLPTEAEWEYAARGPDGLAYPWGNSFDTKNVVYENNSGLHSADIGSKLDGISWIGAYDLSGNVWEWVSDWYGIYLVATQTNPSGVRDGKSHVLRGGSFFSNRDEVRSTFRNWYPPEKMSDDVGFRCARDY